MIQFHQNINLGLSVSFNLSQKRQYIVELLTFNLQDLKLEQLNPLEQTTFFFLVYIQNFSGYTVG